MSTENPFARKPAKQEVDTSWVDLAEGKLGAKGNTEVPPADIESAESRLNTSSARLQEAIAKPVDEKKMEEPDTWEKIQEAWSLAKLRASEAFTALFVTTVGAAIWTGETYDAAQSAIRAGNLGDYTNLTERVAQLQTADMSLIVGTLAVPLVMLGTSKLSQMRSERTRREGNLNKPKTA